MDLGALMGGLLSGRDEEPIPVAPKWLKGRRVCPFLIGDELFWRCSEMIVRGIPPVGTQYGHADPHILPATFGPLGEPKQVIPGAPLLNGLVPMQTELGETLLYTHGRAVRFVSWTIEPYFFAFPPRDNAPQLIAVLQSGTDTEARGEDGRPARIFRTFAFLAPSHKNIHYFLLPEERERLPLYEGTKEQGDDGLHDIEFGSFPYGIVEDE